MIERLQDAPRRFELMIALGQRTQVDGAAHAAHLWVWQSVNHLADAGDDEGTRAHGARLLRYIEGALVEPPVAQRVGRLGNGEYLGVGCGIVGAARLVVRRCNDSARMLNHRPDWHFVLFPGLQRLIVSVRHEIIRIPIEFGRVALFKGT